MSQHYKLVLRNSIPGDKTSPKKYYAMAVSTGSTSLEYLCEIAAARSSLSAADVKGVLDTMNYLLNLELKEGRIVEFGELGHFRIGLGSEGADSIEAFHVSMIREPRIIFYPGKSLQATRHAIKFSKESDTKVILDDEEIFPVIEEEEGDKV